MSSAPPILPYSQNQNPMNADPYNYQNFNQIELEEALKKLKKHEYDTILREKDAKIDELKRKGIQDELDEIKRKEKTIIDLLVTKYHTQPQITIINNVPTITRLPVAPTRKDTKLKIPKTPWIAIIIVNTILPGVGTMIAGCLYGDTPECGDRTGKVLCRGIVQLATCLFIIGWIWSIKDALYYFEQGNCGTCGCVDK
jgi:hypothetical protein